ncbi:MAG TPA: hypothetical protein HA289_03395 [Ferroplasma sp.]|nr:hypothetical protein [Ferroplasma sp.]
MSAGVALAAIATAGLVSGILAIGATVIGLYDWWGGGNGVFFFVHTNPTYAWINSPYNQVPYEYKSGGSYPVTLYNGDLQ